MSTRTVLSIAGGTLFLLAACSSSATSPPATSPSAPSTGDGVTISAQGSALVGPDGHTLYANTVDTATSIKCVGACAKEWPPVTGTVHAGSGVDAAAFGVATRSDGSTQVTFDGHPLYEFGGDKAAGDKNGEGIADEGGSWHVMSPSGIGTSPSSAPSSTGAPSYNY